MEKYFSIIVPVYNSENSIKQLYNKITIVLRDLTDNFEIIFVDDYSLDKSFDVISDISKIDNRVIAIKLDKNYGQQNAVFCGLNYAKGDYIINMDDDLQHNPKYIKAMYEKLLEGYDIVYAVTKVKYHKHYRNLGSKLTDKLFNLLFQKPKDKRVSSYRIMKKSLIDLIIKEKKPYNYISASILKYTKNIGNLHYNHKERLYGDSNYTFLKQLKIFLRIYIYYSENCLIKKFRSQKEPYRVKKIINYEGGKI